MENVAGVTSNTEQIDPGLTMWTLPSQMSHARSSHTATLLGDGHLLVAGGLIAGVADSSAEVLEPVGGWTPAKPMGVPRADHTATLLDDGRVLVAGGRNSTGETLDSAELFTLPLLADGAGCTAPSDCSSGFCVDGVCCDHACGEPLCEACSSARGAGLDGVCTPLHPECSPFACAPATGACATTCASIHDCTAGYACAPTGRCVASSADQAYRDVGGCALAAPEGRGPAPMALAALAALAAVRRRRSASPRW